MAINKAMKRLLRALSYDEIKVNSARHLANLKAIDPLKVFYKTLDYKIYNGDYQVPIRIFFPTEKMQAEEPKRKKDIPVLLYFHGGGWVTDTLDNYERICARLSNATGQIVIAVAYRLAPEHPFPTGLMDCYAVAKALYSNQFILNVSPANITLIGDSAGGNLTAAISLMARDTGDFSPKRQILIYPAVNSDYSMDSPFPSVVENGEGYLLTRGRLNDYINLYARTPDDKENPYFAPIKAKDFSHQPATLILSAEFDPLRDEGEAYGKCLRDAGGDVEVCRIKDALHGYFALGIKFLHVQESFDIIQRFLKKYQ